MVKATMSLSCGLLVLVLFGAGVSAQQIPPPSNPVVFCGQQANPAADSYQLVFNGGTAEPLTMDAIKHAECPAAATHSFSLPASRFTVGTHTVMIKAVNAFGSTDGPAYTVTVGIAPGQFTITFVKG